MNLTNTSGTAVAVYADHSSADTAIKAGLYSSAPGGAAAVGALGAIGAGKFLVIAHGSHQKAERARDILGTAGLAAPDTHVPGAV